MPKVRSIIFDPFTVQIQTNKQITERVKQDTLWRPNTAVEFQKIGPVTFGIRRPKGLPFLGSENR